jgi:hypothetical protein
MMEREVQGRVVPRRHSGVMILLAWAAVLGMSPRPSSAAVVQVLILAGQSNAVGYGSDAAGLPPELAVPQTDIRFRFDEGSIFSLMNPSLRIDSRDRFVPLQFQSDPTGMTFFGPLHGFASEMKIGRIIADSVPLELAIVKFAVSGSSLATDWNPDTPGSLYPQMREEVVAALAALAAVGDVGRVAGFFWMQGEADAQQEASATSYEANLSAFIQRLRADFARPGCRSSSAASM